MDDDTTESAYAHTSIDDILDAELDDANNLMRILDERMVTHIGLLAASGYTEDYESTSKWRADQERIAKMVLREKQAKNTPFQDASNIIYPLITESILQFNARAYSTIMNNGNIALAKVIGADPQGEKKRRSLRVSKDMSYQLNEEIEDWDAGMDQLLMALPQDGLAFKKVYYTTLGNKTAVEVVLAKDLVVNNATRGLRSCPRISQRMPVYAYEVMERIAVGEFDEDAISMFEDEDPSDERIFIEQHCLFDVDGDGYPEPYILTFDEDSGQVVRIVADYQIENVEFEDEEKFVVVAIRRRDYFTKYECFPSPNGDFYTPGFGSLLLEHNEAINTTINQLFDAGRLSNSQSGFLGREFRVTSGSTKITPGEWMKTDVPAMLLKDAIVPLPVREPSMVLFQLMGVLVESGKSIASISDALTGDAPANQPVGTTMSLVEQGMKVYNTIFKRVYRGLRNELRMIFKLNQRFRTDEQYQNILDEKDASVEDYNTENMDVVPAADPNMATDMQKRMRMQALMETMELPFVNKIAIYEEYLMELGIDDPKKYIIPPSNDVTPQMMLELANAENDKQKVANDTAKVAASNRKALAEVVKILQEVANEGGTIGTALAEAGILDLFEQEQAASLQQLKEAQNEQPVQEREAVQRLEGGPEVALGIPNGAGTPQ
jgi:chaperonin GroES